MQSYDHPSVTQHREQPSFDGKFILFQKSKLIAIHLFVGDKLPAKTPTVSLKINGEQIGDAQLSENFGAGCISTPLLNLHAPQCSAIEVTGASGPMVLEYSVLPDADQTNTTVVDRETTRVA